MQGPRSLPFGSDPYRTSPKVIAAFFCAPRLRAVLRAWVLLAGLF